MIRSALLAVLALVACRDEPRAPATFDERYRPLYHFTPDRNWMNDPNGLVFYDGEYHLFFQHNPHGDTWGHLSWGHAVSADLVNWRQLPLAIPERDVMIFSGSAVMDWDNVSGLGAEGAPAMVAIYTGYDPDDHTENQQMSFSLDRGRTWRAFEGNPILEAGRDGMFRDPKVFWHAPTRRWVMTVSRSAENVVSFFVSENLRDWREVSSFGPAGVVAGPWEVPELLEVPVDGGGTRWVLAIGITGDAGPAGGSGVQYFVGDFDGERFTPSAEARWVDYGADFYALQSWSGIPSADGRRIWIAWLANTRYANEQPTSPWRGMLTIPRSVHLVRAGGGLELAQRPVRELEQLRRAHVAAPARDVAPGRIPLPEVSALGEAIEVELTLRTTAEAGLVLQFGASEVRIGYDATAGVVFVDRRRGGDVDMEGFAARHTAPVSPRDGVVTLRLFLDRSSVEVFAQGGTRVITDLIFPEAPFSGAVLYAERGSAQLVRLDAWALAPMNRN